MAEFAPETKQYLKIDIDRLVSDSKVSPEPLFNLFSEYDFKCFKQDKSFRAGKKNGAEIYKINNNAWIAKFHNGDYNGLKGDLWTCVKGIHGFNPSNKDELFQLCRKVCSLAGLNFESYIIDDPNYKQETRREKQKRLRQQKKAKKTKPEPIPIYIPNSGPTKETSSFVFAEDGTQQAKKGFQTLQNKTSLPNKPPEWFKALGANPLQSTKNLKQGYELTYDDDTAIAYYSNPQAPTSGAVKIKIPSKKKLFFLQSQSNYVFCYNYLIQNKDKCKAIIVCAGEDDTFAINGHFNKHGIYGICLQSETTNITEGFLADLRKITPNVLTLFDNDKGKINKRTGKEQNTGLTSSIRQAEKVGIPFIDLSKFTNENDVCDALKKENKEKFLQFLQMQIITRTTIRETKFLPAIPDVDTLDISKNYFDNENYINNKGFESIKITPIQALLNILKNYSNILLKGHCGIGKSTMIETLSKHIKSIGLKRIVFVVPCQGIGMQQAKDYAKNGTLTPVIMQGTDGHDIFDAERSPLIICVYNSLGKISHLIDDECLLIGDEEPLLLRSISQKVGNDFYTYSKRAKNTMIVSATPTNELACDIPELPKFKMVKIKSDSDQILKYQPVHYEGSESDIFHYTDSLKTDSTKTSLYYKNNVNKLEAWEAKAESLGASADIFTSKHRRYKEDNENYKSILETGHLKNFVHHLFYTSLFNVGMSLKDPVDNIILINTYCPKDTIQGAQRARHIKGTDINKDITVYGFKKTPKDKDISDTRTYTQYLNDCIKDAKNSTEIANNYGNKYRGDDLKKTLKKFYDESCIYFCEIDEVYKIDILKILDKAKRYKQLIMTEDDFYQALRDNCPDIIILPVINVNLEEDTETREFLKVNKEELKKLQNETLDIIINEDFTDLLQAYYKESTHHHHRHKIKNHIEITKEVSSNVNNIIDKYKEHFNKNAFDKIIMMYFNIESLLIARGDVSIAKSELHEKIIIVIVENWVKSSYKIWHNSAVAAMEMNKEDVSGKEVLRIVGYKELIKNVKKGKKIFRERNRKSFSKFEIIDIVYGVYEELDNAALFENEIKDGTNQSHAKALKKIKELFSVKSTRVNLTINNKDTKRTYYKIGNLKSGILEKSTPKPSIEKPITKTIEPKKPKAKPEIKETVKDVTFLSFLTGLDNDTKEILSQLNTNQFSNLVAAIDQLSKLNMDKLEACKFLSILPNPEGKTMEVFHQLNTDQLVSILDTNLDTQKRLNLQVSANAFKRLYTKGLRAVADTSIPYINNNTLTTVNDLDEKSKKEVLEHHHNCQKTTQK